MSRKISKALVFASLQKLYQYNLKDNVDLYYKKTRNICGEASSCYLALNRNAGSALNFPKTIDNLKKKPTIGDKYCGRITEGSFKVQNVL